MEDNYSLFDLIDYWEEDLEREEKIISSELKPSNRALSNIFSAPYNPYEVFTSSLNKNIDIYLS